MSEHSIIASSAAGVWGKPKGCPGSVTAALMWPELEETEASREGTAAHSVAEWIINGIHERETAQLQAQTVGEVAPNGVVITDEMFEAAKMYADDVLAVLDDPQVKEYGIEERLSASERIHDSQYGTCDAWALNRATFTLYVWDFKFGRRYVSEYQNWQLICYVAGLLQKLNINGHLDQRLTVKMRVIQPRAYGPGGSVREWSTMASDLRGPFNVLRNNANDALSASPTYRAGEHCRYCPARAGRCQTALDAGFTLYEAATNAMPAEIDAVSVGTLLSIVERAVQQLGDIKTGLEEQALQLFKNGHNVPGYSPEATYSRLEWSRPVEEVEQLGKLLNVNLVKKVPITPTQALDKFEIDDSIISVYCDKRQTGTKLVKTDDEKLQRLFSK